MIDIVLPFIEQVALGAACGFGDFLFCTTTQKTCMLAGVKFEEIKHKDDIPSSRIREFYPSLEV
jgi:hypothetical protein